MGNPAGKGSRRQLEPAASALGRHAEKAAGSTLTHPYPSQKLEIPRMHKTAEIPWGYTHHNVKVQPEKRLMGSLKMTQHASIFFPPYIFARDLKLCTGRLTRTH